MEKEYNVLQKKYGLPKLEVLDKDFQITTIDTKKFLLKEVVKLIVEKLGVMSNILEEILSPERLSSLHESSMFNEDEKKKVLRIFRKIHYFYRCNSLLEISYDEKETAEFITTFFDEWEKIKPDLNNIISKLKESWNSNKKSKLELGYFG